MTQQDCNRIEIEPAENGGFSVRKFYRPQPSKGGENGLSTGYLEPKTYAFRTLDELSAFLHQSFGSGDKSGRTVVRQ